MQRQRDDERRQCRGNGTSGDFPGLVEVVQGKSSQKNGLKISGSYILRISYDFSWILMNVYDYVFACDGDLPCVENTFGNVF